MQAIRVPDQPVMAGRGSLRLTPTFGLQRMAKRLNEILAAEGYAVPPANYVPASGGIRYPIMLLPLPGQNAVLVFAQNEEYLSHIAQWAERSAISLAKELQAAVCLCIRLRNLSAAELAKTLDQLFDGGGRATSAATTAAGKEGQNSAGPSKHDCFGEGGGGCHEQYAYFPY